MKEEKTLTTKKIRGMFEKLFNEIYRKQHSDAVKRGIKEARLKREKVLAS